MIAFLLLFFLQACCAVAAVTPAPPSKSRPASPVPTFPIASAIADKIHSDLDAQQAGSMDMPKLYQYSPELKQLLPNGHDEMPKPEPNPDGTLKDWTLIVFKQEFTPEDVKSHFAWLAPQIASNNNTARLHCLFEMGYAGKFPSALRTQIAGRPEVRFVEEDRLLKLNQGTNAAAANNDPNAGGLSWGLDRLDQTGLPLDGNYFINGPAGAGVDVYILDSGLLPNHTEFAPAGRARLGQTFSTSGTTDGVGHGTHVAGTIGGASVGVAKNATLIAVKVIDNDGSGAASSVIMGLEWVMRQHASQSGPTKRPAVINMSIGGGRSTTLDMAVLAAIKSGITVVAAAGNDNHDACLDSPANLLPVITVGASTPTDTRATFSNFGNCVKIFAPGLRIRSSWKDSPTSFMVLDGTSMASPHVAGVVAVYLSMNPTATPQQVKDAIIGGADNGRLANLDAASPNKVVSLAGLGPFGAGGAVGGLVSGPNSGSQDDQQSTSGKAAGSSRTGQAVNNMQAGSKKSGVGRTSVGWSLVGIVGVVVLGLVV